MPSEPTPSATNAGIVTDTTSGERHIPPSTRPDGSTRKPIKIRPGYRPPEDVELYKNRTAEAFRERGRRIGIPGAAAAGDDEDDEDGGGKGPASAAANKNAKRREARKKAKVAAGDGDKVAAAAGSGKEGAAPAPAGKRQPEGPEELDPELEKQKKARNIKKKLKQAKELKNKKEGGETLLPEQIAKVIKINELIRELDALGLDAEGEPRKEGEPAGDDKKADK